MSDYFLEEARLQLVGGRRARMIEGVRNVLKVSELNNRVNVRAYQESLHGKCGEVGKSRVWRKIGKSS